MIPTGYGLVKNYSEVLARITIHSMVRSAFVYVLFASSLLSTSGFSQSTGSHLLSLNGFNVWLTGRDTSTIQLIPRIGRNALMMEGGKTVVHVRFKVKQYGEVHTPLNTLSAPNAEAQAVDLSGSKSLKIRYKSNQTVTLQLRQTGVHGGVHNHVLLPASPDFTTTTIQFSAFKGGLQPLNLKDVAKFNFAFVANNEKDGFADLVIQSLVIDKFKPKEETTSYR